MYRAMSEEEARAALKSSAEDLVRLKKISFEQAMKAIMDGFKAALIQTGDPLAKDKDKITVDLLIQMMVEGKFEEVEQKAAKATVEIKKKQAEAKKGGSFQRAPKKNKFV